MSVFSKLRRSKKAAEEHNANKAQNGKEPEVKVPYKHVPTHAAHDALSCSPAAWKEQDRPRIREHHKRRSDMAISRTQSTLSTASNMNDRAISIAGSAYSSSTGLPRNSSYNSFHTTSFNEGDLEMRRRARVQSQYGPKSTSYGRIYPRGHSYTDSGVGPSPLSSTVQSEETSPVVSSGNSTNSSSSDDLEISSRPARNAERTKSSPEQEASSSQLPTPNTSTSRKSSIPKPITVPAPVVVRGSMPTTQVVAQEQKQKKQRWSIRGRKTTASITA